MGALYKNPSLISNPRFWILEFWGSHLLGLSLEEGEGVLGQHSTFSLLLWFARQVLFDLLLPSLWDLISRVLVFPKMVYFEIYDFNFVDLYRIIIEAMDDLETCG